MEEEHGTGPAKASGDDDYDAAGTRLHPYYGCTFCRRGFSNAQALGGHMNIHRKDRVKAQPPPRPPMASSSVCHGGSGAAGYTVHSSQATSAERTMAQCFLGEDLGLGLSSSSTGRYRCHRDATGSVAPGGEARRQEVDEDGEVDLELRLGHQLHYNRHAV
ncbi:hypothetical protein ZIOFF_037270 [Zingiber officinale]|uniref:C2H2-type domain-containing protein n=1 Tax=Zingiber officinale TaxID=94328 RepID=A0A8J5GK33_ZINOF|nr:hypothetical protein ZIOFF_037270 [Zingiber officinale]